MPNSRTKLLLAGPPASGKSSLASHLQAALPQCEYVSLDTEVLALCAERQHRGPLPDDMIDEAVRRLLTNLKGDSPLIVELPHHDYITLVKTNRLNPAEYACTTVITAPYEALRQREQQRGHSIPREYIARCVGAAEALCAWLGETGSPFLRFDSRFIDPRQMCECITAFLRKDQSHTLSKLAIAPQPLRPYLGGNLLNSVEWDAVLAGALIDRFQVRTALDIGCGTGLTLDRFCEKGVDAWGIEGNPAVLEGPSQHRHRLLVADFTKQWVQWPVQVDLTWCVEVIEHVPQKYEDNVLQTIARNTRRIAFLTAAKPGQPGYHHVNCQPQDYWIERLAKLGLCYAQSTQEILSHLDDQGPFGTNLLKDNGMIFETKL